MPQIIVQLSSEVTHGQGYMDAEGQKYECGQ